MKKLFIVGILLLLLPSEVFGKSDPRPDRLVIWDVRSVDTMKTSRDLAREKLHDSSYDRIIERDLQLIKDLGANYVAIDTPYDEEFFPYLVRWVKLAREAGLNVWFRGNFSGWEGWFDHKKDLTPQEHIRRTAQFIESHRDIFKDGDAFDPCPECENAQWWPQPSKDKEYKEFVINQQVNLKASFAKINKKVHTNWTGIIGGRAKEVLDDSSITSLDKIVAIDHYTASIDNMNSYIKYFSDSFGAKTLVSEFGAPIPDIHGRMNDKQQADFIDSMMNTFYANKEHVYGLNYFALGTGTTEIIDSKGSPKLAYYVIKKYYSPAIINGIVTDQLGQKIKGVTVATVDNKSSSLTDKSGHYSLVVPAQNTNFVVSSEAYSGQSFQLNLTYNQNIEQNLVLEPTHPSWIYTLRMWLKNRSKRPMLSLLQKIFTL